MKPLHFLSLLALTAFVAALGVLSFNQAGLVSKYSNRKSSEWHLARSMVAGKHLPPPAAFKEEELRWDLAALLESPPDIAVIGSSHGLLVSRTKIPAPSLYNFCISGACLPEGLVTSALLEQRGMLPRVMLVFVDPWLFDRSVDFPMWRARGEELVKYEQELCAGTPPLKPIFAARFTPASKIPFYKHYTLQTLTDAIDEAVGYLPFNQRFVDEPEKAPFNVMRADGAWQIATDHTRDNEPGSRETALRQFAHNIDRHRYGIFEKVDEDLWRLFSRWLQHCRAKGVEIWFVLPPYHPAIYPEILADPRSKLSLVEARAKILAKELDAKIFGSYDPAQLGFADSLFSDGDHLNGAGVQRLLEPAARAWAELDAQKPRPTKP